MSPPVEGPDRRDTASRRRARVPLRCLLRQEPPEHGAVGRGERTAPAMQEHAQVRHVPSVGPHGVGGQVPFEIEVADEALDQLSLSVGKLVWARHGSLCSSGK